MRTVIILLAIQVGKVAEALGADVPADDVILVYAWILFFSIIMDVEDFHRGRSA